MREQHACWLGLAAATEHGPRRAAAGGAAAGGRQGSAWQRADSVSGSAECGKHTLLLCVSIKTHEHLPTASDTGAVTCSNRPQLGNSAPLGACTPSSFSQKAPKPERQHSPRHAGACPTQGLARAARAKKCDLISRLPRRSLGPTHGVRLAVPWCHTLSTFGLHRNQK